MVSDASIILCRGPCVSAPCHNLELLSLVTRVALCRLTSMEDESLLIFSFRGMSGPKTNPCMRISWEISKNLKIIPDLQNLRKWDSRNYILKNLLKWFWSLARFAPTGIERESRARAGPLCCFLNKTHNLPSASICDLQTFKNLIYSVRYMLHPGPVHSMYVCMCVNWNKSFCNTTYSYYRKWVQIFSSLFYSVLICSLKNFIQLRKFLPIPGLSMFLSWMSIEFC